MGDPKDNFSKGAYFVSRSIFESDIWFKPPEYVKIFFYLFGKANHKARKYKGFFCNRGQYFCTYDELKEQIQYKIGYRTKIVNVSKVKNIVKYLRENQMVSTEKYPRGVLFTVINYEKYQNLDNYEKTNNKPQINRNSLPINKNDKELNTNPLNIKEYSINKIKNDKKSNFINEFLNWSNNKKVNRDVQTRDEEIKLKLIDSIKFFGIDNVIHCFRNAKEIEPNLCREKTGTDPFNMFWEHVDELNHRVMRQ